jgi:predicted MPP superfamily phosphohydrolase
MKSDMRALIDRIAMIILVIGLFLGFYASCVEPFQLKVTTWSVTTPKWDNPKPLKIAILTDMHMIWPWMTPGHLERIVKATNDLHPDIVLLLGDYVGTHFFGKQIAPVAGVAPLKNLTPACGVYAVTGNHDLHPPRGWIEALRSADIPVLENQTRPVNCHGQKFWIAGLEDLWWQHPDARKTVADVKDRHPVIMMMHNPDIFPTIPDSIALSVAGHTHGGQVKFPFIGAIASVIPSQYGKRYLYGHIIEEGKDLIVSSGLGMTGLPIRFMTPPEISFVSLQSSAE